MVHKLLAWGSALFLAGSVLALLVLNGNEPWPIDWTIADEAGVGFGVALAALGLTLLLAGLLRVPDERRR